MENLDLTVLRALRDWRSAGHHALMATVVRTWGSSPRPVGSIMGLCDSGAVVGSVSGGCIEDDLIARYTRPDAADALQPAAGGAPSFVKYGVTADEAHRFGLPCGGTLELLLEFDPDAAQLADLVRALEGGRLMRRSVALADGRATLVTAQAPAALSVDARELANTFGPEYRMLIIGAGQMSEYLATMALFSGFAVTVCDPREEYRGAWSVDGARVLADMPDDVVAAFRPDRRSCVVALTHDPKLDDLALLEALDTEAFYVGAIGSRRNNASRRERLKEHFGRTEADLARLRGPIGIYIGSKTPPEIAVSIMAEVLAVKNGAPLPRDLDVAYVKNAQTQAAAESACGVGVSAPQAVPPLAAVVMAAGAGRRMGHRPKALLRRDGEPLVVRTVRLLREAGVAPVAVVLGHHATQVQAALAQSEALARLGGWRCATNPDPDAGPGSSLRAGLEALQDAPGAVLVALADHPLLEAQDLTWLRERWAKRAADHHLLVPVRAGQPGHPLILDEALRREVLAMPADEGVREWRRRHPDQVWSASVEHERFHADVDEEVRLLELEARHGVALQWPDEWGRASGGDPGG